MKRDVTQVTGTLDKKISCAPLDTYGIDDRSYTCFLFFFFSAHWSDRWCPYAFGRSLSLPERDTHTKNIIFASISAGGLPGLLHWNSSRSTGQMNREQGERRRRRKELERATKVAGQAGHLLRHRRGEIKMMEYGDIISSGRLDDVSKVLLSFKRNFHIHEAEEEEKSQQMGGTDKSWAISARFLVETLCRRLFIFCIKIFKRSKSFSMGLFSLLLWKAQVEHLRHWSFDPVINLSLLFAARFFIWILISPFINSFTYGAGWFSSSSVRTQIERFTL